MDQGFIDILKIIIKEHGIEAIVDAGKCKAFLADYTKGEFKKESRLLQQALDAKVQKAIHKAQDNDIESCRKVQIRILHEEHNMVETRAKTVVDLLVYVLKGIEKEKNCCKKCGKELPEEWKSCPYCGTAVTPAGGTPPKPTPTPPKPASPPPTPPKPAPTPAPSKPAPPPTPSTDKKAYRNWQLGNTFGNINNGGYAAIKGEWIFYQNLNDGSKLYRIKTDGTSCSKLCDDKVAYINITGAWLYYSNIDDDRRIYKIRTDGTNRSKFSDNSYCLGVILAGDWIYYRGSFSSIIYKINIDGSQFQKLGDEKGVFINVADDWVYFIKNRTELCKIRKDGTGSQKISSGKYISINVSGDFIYFRNGDDGDKLYKIQTDGKNRCKLCDDNADSINVAGEWIYYANKSDGGKIYKIGIDGSGRQKLNDISSCSINIAGAWIYFQTADQKKLYKMRTDGKNCQIVK